MRAGKGGWVFSLNRDYLRGEDNLFSHFNRQKVHSYKSVKTLKNQCY